MMLLLIMLGLHLPPVHEPEIPVLRSLYHLAHEDKNASQDLSRRLQAVDSQSRPILLCYKGAALLFEAKHLSNPFTRLKRFNQGRTLIEQAIARNQGNLEMRFIRFSIQTNLPMVLGYRESIKNDRKFLLQHVKSSADITLKKNITEYLLASGHCTAVELSMIK